MWLNIYCLMIFECNYTVIVIVENFYTSNQWASYCIHQVISKSLQSSLILMVTLADGGSMSMALGSNRNMIQREKEANMIMDDFMLKRK